MRDHTAYVDRAEEELEQLGVQLREADLRQESGALQHANHIGKVKDRLGRKYKSLLLIGNLTGLDTYEELLFGSYEEAVEQLVAKGYATEAYQTGKEVFALLKRIRAIIGTEYGKPKEG